MQVAAKGCACRLFLAQVPGPPPGPPPHVLFVLLLLFCSCYVLLMARCSDDMRMLPLLQVLTDYEALPRVFHNVETSQVR